MIIRAKLNDICDISAGGTPSRGNSGFYNSGTIKWVKSGELSQGDIYNTDECITQLGLDNSSAKLFPVNTVLIAMYGATVGSVGILRTEAATNQAVCGIQAPKTLLPEFLYYFLKSKKEHLVRKAAGGGQPNISAGIIKNLVIFYPDNIDEQRAIVENLSKQFSAIDALAEKTEQQLQYAISLAARVNKQTILFDGKKQPISKYCSEDKRIIQPESEDAKTLKYLGMENIDKDSWEYIASTDILLSGNSTTYYFNENHVLYGKLRPYLKKVFLPKEAGRCSTELIPLLPADTMEREYLALLLTDDDLVSYIMSESTGARMPRSDMKKLLAYKVAVPDIDEQRARLKARNEQMKKCTELIIKLCKQQENITALRECVFKEAFGNEE